MRILVVEGELQINDVIKEYLVERGFRSSIPRVR